MLTDSTLVMNNERLSNIDKLKNEFHTKKRGINGEIINSANLQITNNVHEPDISTVNTATVGYVRNEIKPKLFIENHNYLKIISWNINGIASAIKNNHRILHDLVEIHKPDILCLQETKIQNENVPEYANILDDYHSFWNCSTIKKGTNYYLNIYSFVYYSHIYCVIILLTYKFI